METLKNTDAALSNSNKPLAIVVTHEGSEFVKLRALALEAIPMLLRPNAYPQTKRQQIAIGFRSILEDDCFDSDIEGQADFPETAYGDEDEHRCYEPGECLVWPEEEDS